MDRRSHTAESFSRFIVAMIVVLIGAGAVIFAFSMFNDTGCAAYLPSCNHHVTPAQ